MEQQRAVGATRWLLFASHVPADGGGGGMVRYTVELARALGRQSGVELHALVDREALEGLSQIMEIDRDRMHPTSGGVVLSSLKERLGRVVPGLDSFDVIHGTKHILPRASAGLRVLTIHDFLPIDRPRDFTLAKRALLPRPYLASVRDADLLVCVSEATKRRLVELVPAAAPRASVVHLALSDDLLDAKPLAVAGLVGRRFALVVGDPSPGKNIRFLTQLWPAVRAQVPDLVLAIAGPAGWGVLEGLTEVEELAARDAAVLLGRISDRELRWAYENAAVVLAPSRLEGFGLPAFEAVTFGAALITSPDPALAEACGGRAEVVSLSDPWGWVSAISRVVDAPRTSPAASSPRRWSDVAAETVAAVRRGRNV